MRGILVVIPLLSFHDSFRLVNTLPFETFSKIKLCDDDLSSEGTLFFSTISDLIAGGSSLSCEIIFTFGVICLRCSPGDREKLVTDSEASGLVFEQGNDSVDAPDGGDSVSAGNLRNLLGVDISEAIADEFRLRILGPGETGGDSESKLIGNSGSLDSPMRLFNPFAFSVEVLSYGKIFCCKSVDSLTDGMRLIASACLRGIPVITLLARLPFSDGLSDFFEGRLVLCFLVFFSTVGISRLLSIKFISSNLGFGFDNVVSLSRCGLAVIGGGLVNSWYSVDRFRSIGWDGVESLVGNNSKIMLCDVRFFVLTDTNFEVSKTIDFFTFSCNSFLIN